MKTWYLAIPAVLTLTASTAATAQSPSPAARPPVTGLDYDSKAELDRDRQEAEKGDKEAQRVLCEAYIVGVNIARDYAAAFTWCRRAAEQNEVEAQLKLADLYANGQGTPRDIAAAAQWYMKAADPGGHSEAQAKIAAMYETGQGMPKDLVQAYRWYSVAALDREPGAGQSRDALAAKMTPSQIVEGKRLAATWDQRNFFDWESLPN